MDLVSYAILSAMVAGAAASAYLVYTAHQRVMTEYDGKSIERILLRIVIGEFVLLLALVIWQGVT